MARYLGKPGARVRIIFTPVTGFGIVRWGGNANIRCRWFWISIREGSK